VCAGATIGRLGPHDAAIRSAAAAGPCDTGSGGQAVGAGTGEAGIDRDADESEAAGAKRIAAAGRLDACR